MGRIFYTSDLHIGHEAALSFDNRPFKDLEEMAQVIRENWNRKVSKQDKVYILGDLTIKEDKRELERYINSLNGTKVLIVGNHDLRYVRDGETLNCFESIFNMTMVKDNGYSIVLCHYPMAIWSKQHYGALHLYGHVHNHTEALDRHPILGLLDNTYNVGIMNWNYEPVTLNEILNKNNKHRSE